MQARILLTALDFPIELSIVVLISSSHKSFFNKTHFALSRAHYVRVELRTKAHLTEKC